MLGRELNCLNCALAVVPVLARAVSSAGKWRDMGHNKYVNNKYACYFVRLFVTCSTWFLTDPATLCQETATAPGQVHQRGLHQTMNSCQIGQSTFAHSLLISLPKPGKSSKRNLNGGSVMCRHSEIWCAKTIPPWAPAWTTLFC